MTDIREITQNPVFQFYESILSEKTDCLWTESGQNIESFIILIEHINECMFIPGLLPKKNLFLSIHLHLYGLRLYLYK